MPLDQYDAVDGDVVYHVHRLARVDGEVVYHLTTVGDDQSDPFAAKLVFVGADADEAKAYAEKVRR